MSALDKVLRLNISALREAGLLGNPGADYVRAAAGKLDELALLLADSDEDDDGEGDDRDEDDDSDDPKAKKKPPFAKKKSPPFGKKKVKASALLSDAMLALSHLQGGEDLGPAVEPTEAQVVLGLAGRSTRAEALVPMSHAAHNGSHSHAHRVVSVVDGEHYHNHDSRHPGDGMY